MKQVKLLLIFISVCIVWQASAHAQVFMAKDGYVEFISKAPLHEFKGKSNHLNGLLDFEKNLVDFYVDLNTLTTGIEKRDRDMKNTYLNTVDFPFAEFTGKLVNIADINLLKDTPVDVKVEGKFSLHGVDRNILVSGVLKNTSVGVQLEATWSVLLKDYGIERPGFIFYDLSEEQIISINILLKELE